MTSENSLALKRTFMAHERTLMAWIRTSTFLITFGFTIYKFFAYLVDADDTPLAGSMVGPREYALAMISMAMIAVPNRYESSAWRRITARTAGDVMSVSDTWYVMPMVNAT